MSMKEREGRGKNEEMKVGIKWERRNGRGGEGRRGMRQKKKQEMRREVKGGREKEGNKALINIKPHPGVEI